MHILINFIVFHEVKKTNKSLSKIIPSKKYVELFWTLISTLVRLTSVLAYEVFKLYCGKLQTSSRQYKKLSIIIDNVCRDVQNNPTLSKVTRVHTSNTLSYPNCTRELFFHMLLWEQTKFASKWVFIISCKPERQKLAISSRSCKLLTKYF